MIIILHVNFEYLAPPDIHSVVADLLDYYLEEEQIQTHSHQKEELEDHVVSASH
jgi:hypothetical protein